MLLPTNRIMSKFPWIASLARPDSTEYVRCALLKFYILGNMFVICSPAARHPWDQVDLVPGPGYWSCCTWVSVGLFVTLGSAAPELRG